MTRLLMAGWETGDIVQLGGASSSGAAIVPTVVSATPAPRSGTYSLKCFPNVLTNSLYSRLNIQHASKTEVYYAFAVYRSNATEPAGPPANAMFWVQDTSGNGNLYLTCEADGAVRAYVQASASFTAGLTLLGTCPTAVPLATWTLIEVHLVASTTTTGTCEVRINGAAQFSATGIRTCQANANFGAVALHFHRVIASSGAAVSYYAFDDLRVNDTSGAVNNTWCGDGSIRALIPNGVGATIGGTPLTGTPGAPNWQNIDEQPASSADYNAGSVVGTGELYALTDPPSLGSCAAINIIAQAFNSDAGGGSLGLTLNSGGANSEGAAQALTVTPTYYNRLLEVDPSDAAAWTQAKLTALQVGMTVR